MYCTIRDTEGLAVTKPRGELFVRTGTEPMKEANITTHEVAFLIEIFYFSI